MRRPSHKYTFDTEKGIFTLYDPETGKDWSNKLLNDAGYVLEIAHYGSTCSRYVNDESVTVTLNVPGTNFVYLRDAETKEYWNIGGMPSLHKISGYACEHGQQFTRISSECKKIRAEIVYALSPDDTREVWQVTVENTSHKRRTIDVFAAMAFDLNGYAQPVYYSAATTSATSFVPEANAVFCQNDNPYRPHARSSGYILSSENVKAYDGNYEKFIGTMGTITKPRVLEKGIDCTNSAATVRARGGILQNELSLAPGETRTLYYAAGLTESRETLIAQAPHIGYGRSGADVCSAIVREALDGEARFGKLRTVCPSPRCNRVFNFWAEHQVRYCMLGKKAVRDNAQLGLAMLDFDPEFARKTIEECLEHQYADGHAVLTWLPYLEKNTYSDPSTWLVFAACEYIKESGDFGWLDKDMRYMDGGSGTVRAHLRAAAEWFARADNIGPHGLPKICHADWNDALNIPDENAESVMTAMLICRAYDCLAELAAYTGDETYAAQMRERKRALADTINAVAYNGEYYVRAFSKFGTVGDKNCAGGKIYVNPQSWSILSNVCPPERRKSVTAAMDSMETEYGVPMCAPPYATYDEHVGRMSGMLAGVYENGGIYNHAGCFSVMANCALGRGDRAVALLEKIIPDGKNNPSTITGAEPYVFTNCYLKHPSVDMQVGSSWQTGTSAWGLMCYFEGILGLKRDYDGLHIRPALPPDWDVVTAYRHYRGNVLKIKYYNRGGTNVSLMVDGKAVAGDRVPLFADAKEHHIAVFLE